MTDPIERADAIKAIRKCEFESDMPSEWYSGMDTAKAILKDIPSADVVEVVRCEKCKHYDDRREDSWWSQNGACLLTTRLGDTTYREPDDYCSRGERRSDE